MYAQCNLTSVRTSVLMHEDTVKETSKDSHKDTHVLCNCNVPRIYAAYSTTHMQHIVLRICSIEYYVYAANSTTYIYT